MTDRNAETIPPSDANRVCTHERNRKRIVDEVERRFGESRSPFAPSGSVVPAAFRANVSIPDVVNFVLGAAEADRDSLLRRIDKLNARRAADREVVANAEMTLAELAAAKQDRDDFQAAAEHLQERLDELEDERDAANERIAKLEAEKRAMHASITNQRRELTELRAALAADTERGRRVNERLADTLGCECGEIEIQDAVESLLEAK